MREKVSNGTGILVLLLAGMVHTRGVLYQLCLGDAVERGRPQDGLEQEPLHLVFSRPWNGLDPGLCLVA